MIPGPPDADADAALAPATPPDASTEADAAQGLARIDVLLSTLALPALTLMELCILPPFEVGVGLAATGNATVNDSTSTSVQRNSAVQSRLECAFARLHARGVLSMRGR
jgi:hypothetical protein